MKKWFAITIHILFWILTAWLLTSSYSVQSNEVEIINGVETVKIIRSNTLLMQLLAVIFSSVLMFYGNLWLILKFSSTSGNKKVVTGSILIFSVFLLLYYLFELLPGFPAWPPLPENLHWGITIFYYAVSVTYAVSILWLRSEKIQQNLIFQKKQAELSLLRSQLQPHFLFNTLNNLLAMVDQKKDPLLADAIERLSGLLRYVVYETQAGRVSVKKEIDFIRNYCELQRLRFEQNEVQVNINIKGQYEQQMVEAGIFIPFVENAFKYGTQPEKESLIEFEFDLSDKSKIIFASVNPIYTKTMQSGKNGSGIISIRERLKLVYPGRHLLDISKNGHFKVELEIMTDESYYN